MSTSQNENYDSLTLPIDIIKHHIYPHASIEFHGTNTYWYCYGFGKPTYVTDIFGIDNDIQRAEAIYKDPRIKSNVDIYFIRACKLGISRVINSILQLFNHMSEQFKKSLSYCVKYNYIAPFNIILQDTNLCKLYGRYAFNYVYQYNNKQLFSIYLNKAPSIVWDNVRLNHLKSACRYTTRIFRQLFNGLHNKLLNSGRTFSNTLIVELINVCCEYDKSTNLEHILKYYNVSSDTMYVNAFFEKSYTNKSFNVLEVFVKKNLLQSNKFIFEDVFEHMLKCNDINILKILHKYGNYSYLYDLIKIWIRYADKQRENIICKIFNFYIKPTYFTTSEYIHLLRVY